MKAKILAAFCFEHPELEVLMVRAGDYKEIKPTVTTCLHEDILDEFGQKVVVKEDKDFVLLTGAEL